MRSSPLPRMSRRGRVTVGVLIGVFLFFTLLGWVVDAWTDWLWFDEVTYTQVFTAVLRTRVLLFLVFGLAMALLIGGNLYLAYRLRPLIFPHSPEQHTLERYRMILTPRIGTWIALVAGVVGLFTGLSAQGHWTEWMLFSNSQQFGVKDPEFGVDVSFYVFEYPLWRYLLGVALTATVLSVLGAVAMHYVYGAVRLTGAGDRMTNTARAHLTSLVAVFVLLKAAAYFLDRRGLLLGKIDIEGPDLHGAGYSAINALLPAKEILAYISIVVAIAIIVFSNAYMRNLVWPGISLAMLVVSAIAIGGIYPWAVQSFTVNPSLLEKERPYIQRSIDATRAGYRLTDTKITEYPANNLTPPASLATDTSIVPNIRLLDPAVVSDTYTQLQQVRGFYDFGQKLDIDRYTIDGRTQDYIVGVRELDPGKLVDAQRNWLNRHTVFTHGYGLVAAPANRVGRDGQPCFVSGLLNRDAEQQAGTASCSSPTERIPTDEPRVYYGERLTDYAVVGKGQGGRDVEFDRPAGAAGDQYYTYQGNGGVEIGSYLRRLLYAAKYREANFLLSDAVNDSSRLLYVREPRSRVEKVAPFLTLDGDPYPAVVEGRIVWIVDGYTTASTYPYAQQTNLQAATNDTLTNVGTFQLARQNINYIRNSVKATVDAYNGTVTLYAFDDTDPVLKAWNQAFGGNLIKPRDAMPEQLKEHLRYPADLFKVQRDLLARFHVTDSNEFFSGQNFWEVPADPAQQGPNKQPPYYLLTKLPGQADTRFQLTAAVTPAQRQNLAALISGSYVDNKPVLEVLELPPENRIPGPGQAQQSMENDATARSQLTLLSSATSVVVKGNLLSLPFGGGMLYVEPIYLKSNVENPYPLLKKVLLNYGDRVAFADTLEDGIKQLVASAGQQPPTTEPPPGGEPPPGVPGDLASAAADVRKAIDEVRAAQQAGDFERYGKALANLDAALKRFEEAQKRATTPSPGG